MEQHEGIQRDPMNRDPVNPPRDENIQTTPLAPNHNLAGPTNGAAPPPGNQPPDDEANLTAGQWFRQNGFTLTIVLFLLGYLFVKFDTEGLLAIAKAALGLSFVIFIHELGHFLVAKWCDVHVTTFSIGFGPALPGCSFKRGETTYKLALFPLGGYVQMVGQVDGDETSDGSEDDPRSYRNKTVAQRMAIISAGVIMNVILAIVSFVVVFQGPGKDRQAAVVGYPDTGSPAFIKGLSSGSQILQIGSVENPYFEDLMAVVMASSHGEELDLVAKKFGSDHVLRTEIMPRKNADDISPKIGIAPSDRLEFARRRFLDPDFKSPALPRSPAYKAYPPFQSEDRIIATTDPDNPGQIKELPDDPRYPNHNQRDYFEFMRRMQLLAGKEVIIRVVRGEKKDEIDVKVSPAFHPSLGVRMHMGQITAIREGSPAAYALLQARDEAKNVKGDLIEAVTILGPDGKPGKTFEGTSLDPLKLPYQLRQEMAKVKTPKKEVTLQLRRSRAGAGAAPGPENEKVQATLAWKDEWTFDQAVPLGLSSPWAIPELGLAYVVKTTVAEVLESGPKANPLQKWDEIKELRPTYYGLPDEEKEIKDPSWITFKNDEQWAAAFRTISELSPKIKSISLKVERNKKIEEVDITLATDDTWPMTDRGWIFMKDVRRQKAGNIFEAVALGLKDTHNYMLQVFQNMRGMILNRLSIKMLGGPITIARVAYRFAGIDFWEFIFFLGVISVNLAVINFLPIPVLDGGHMVFLIYEKVRGKPASEGVRAGATYAGLALILCLMIFVIYLDISRLFL